MRPQLVLIAGPNGAGKSTFYDEFLQGLNLPFLNADQIEASTNVPSIEIARVLDVFQDSLIEKGAGFITETVFSDSVGAKLGMLRKALDVGYAVTLIYIGVEPVLMGLRVDQRVAAGGHDVPRDRLASRFERSLANLREAIQFVPIVKIYDNSLVDDPFRLIAVFEKGVEQKSRARVRRPLWFRKFMRTLKT